MTLKRTTPLKRKPAKRRPAGVGCQGRGIGGRVCRSNAIMTVDDIRFCAKHAADRLVGNFVKERDGHTCRACGREGPVDWAHVWRRSYLAVRWDPANAVALCREDHTRFTNRGAEWEQWCRDEGIDWDALRRRALTEPPMQALDVIALYEGDAA